VARERFLQLSPLRAQSAGVAAFTPHRSLYLAVMIRQLQKQAGAGVHFERYGKRFRAGLPDQDHFAANHSLHLLDPPKGGRGAARAETVLAKLGESAFRAGEVVAQKRGHPRVEYR